MKKLIWFSFVALFIMASCSKSERSDFGIYPDEIIKAGPESSQVIVVPPDKDGDGDDTEELRAAIDAAGPGTLIQLLEGEYHVGYLEVYGFHGVIAGAGSEKTLITMKTPIDQIAQIASNQSAGWWRLIGGDITISNIAFKTPDGFLSEEGGYDPNSGSDLFAMFLVNNYNDEYYHPEEQQKLIVKSCNFIGGTNTDTSKDVYWKTDHNTYIAIWVGMEYYWPKENLDYPLTKGDYMFKDCYFEHFLDGVEGFSLGELATMEVSKCKLNNCMWPLFFLANYNSNIYITENIFTNSQEYDIAIDDWDAGFLPNTIINPIRRCSYVITGNQFNKSTVSSIYLCDWGIGQEPVQGLPMMITVKGNQFNLSGSGIAVTAYNSQDAVIRNNTFSGTCDKGILIDGASQELYGAPIPLEVYANNVLVLGNNFNGLKATTASIVLGEKSSNCNVVGNGKDSVIDNGTDNKIVGMKPKTGGYHAGPTIRDNLRNFHGMRPH